MCRGVGTQLGYPRDRGQVGGPWVQAGKGLPTGEGHRQVRDGTGEGPRQVQDGTGEGPDR